MSAFPEVSEAKPAQSKRAFEEVPPAEANFFQGLGQVPHELMRTLLAGPLGGGELGGQEMADQVTAEGGDQEAAARLQARGLIASGVGSLIPGGGGIAARAGLGALGGGISGGLEAGASGQPIGPAAGRGALFGGVVGGLTGIPGAMGRKVGTRAAKVGTEVAGEAAPAVGRLVQALESVPKKLEEQELLTRAGRARQIKGFLGTKVTGEQSARSALSRMGGQLPKVQLESLRGLVDQNDIDAVFRQAVNSPLLSTWEKPTAVGALNKLFEAAGTKIPSKSELAVLEKALGSPLVETLLKRQDTLSKWQRLGLNLAASPREIMASMDLSAPMRQGLFLGAGHPKEFASAFGTMFKAISQAGTNELEMQIAQRPTYNLMNQAGLAITKAGSAVGAGEEMFAGSLARQIPGIGGLIKGSERAYTGFLNKLRADVFDSMIQDVGRSGSPMTLKTAKAIAGFVNAGTGRGALPGKFLQKVGPALNQALFSPRLLASRIQTLNPALYVTSPKIVRWHAWRSLLGLAGAATSALALAKLSGAEVETDPLNADWGKIKVGNTRYDILGGYQQYLRLGALMINGMAEGEGVSGKVSGAVRPTGRFLQNKLAPIPALAVKLWQRENPDLNVPDEVRQMYTPMIIQDAIEAGKDWGYLGGAAGTLPSVFGVGMQTYEQ